MSLRRYGALVVGAMLAAAACGGSGNADDPGGGGGGVEPGDAGRQASGDDGAVAEPERDAAPADGGAVETDADADANAGPPPTFSVYDADGRLVGQYDALGAPVIEFAYLHHTPIAAMTPAATYTVHADHLGTPRALANAANQTVWRWDGDAFGSTSPDEDPDGDGAKVTLPLRFPGQVFDGETGLHYNVFRDYDPAIARYLQPDPIGLGGGFNVYAYVGSAPSRAVDPLGLEEVLPSDVQGMLPNEAEAYRRSMGGGEAPSNGSSTAPSGSESPYAGMTKQQLIYQSCMNTPNMTPEMCLKYKPEPPPPKSLCKRLFGDWWRW